MLLLEREHRREDVPRGANRLLSNAEPAEEDAALLLTFSHCGGVCRTNNAVPRHRRRDPLAVPDVEAGLLRRRRVPRFPGHAGVEDSEPNWSPDGTRIALVSDRDGDLDVYTMLPNGSSVRQLTFNDGFEFRPNWSPDGGQITFTSGRDGDAEVYVMDADGTNQTNVTANPAGDDGFSAWSPDGEKIAYVSIAHDVLTMNADGSGKVSLTKGPAFEIDPDWQPLLDGD